jgi:6-phosphogluconolactonase
MHNSIIRCLAGLALLTAAGVPAPAAAAEKGGSKSLVYFGTYTGPKSKGVYSGRFDSQTGQLTDIKVAGEIQNPSWVTIHPNGRYLYAVTEIGNDARSEATLSSFSIDPASGDLKFLNKVSTGGGGACHLAIDKTAKSIAVANYGSGSTAVFRLEADGTLGQRTGFQQHSGSSVNQRRQRGPHAHAVVFSPDNRFLLVPDLGMDEVISYRFDAGAASLTPDDPPYVKVKPGLGPRHFAFHPKGRFAYGLNEMGSAVTAFSYDPAKGVLTELQTISTLAPDFKGENNSAELMVDRAGRFVYASNRGDDSITVFAIDSKQGKLTEVERVPTQGKIPRSFGIDPTGKFLLAANQNSGNVVIFRVDEKSGKLTPTGQVVEVPSAVCVQFLAAR